VKHKFNFVIAGMLLVGLGVILALNGADTVVALVWPAVMGGQFLTWFTIGRREGFLYAEELREQRVKELS
jgi:hypothetical protein